MTDGCVDIGPAELRIRVTYRPNWPLIIRDAGLAVFAATTAVMLVRRIRG